MNLFVVGGPYFTARPPFQEGIEFNFQGDYTLVISLPDLTEMELYDLRGPCQFGAYVERGILFFLYRFGTSFDWGDAPYNWWLNQDRTIPSCLNEETRALLNIIVVDSNTNTILQMRAVTIPPLVTQTIVQAIVDQTNTPSMNILHKSDPQYGLQLNDIRKRHSTKDMARLGIIGIGGE